MVKCDMLNPILTSKITKTLHQSQKYKKQTTIGAAKNKLLSNCSTLGLEYPLVFYTEPQDIFQAERLNLYEEAKNGDVQTMRIGDYISGYDQIISDHRPVVWRFTP